MYIQHRPGLGGPRVRPNGKWTPWISAVRLFCSLNSHESTAAVAHNSSSSTSSLIHSALILLSQAKRGQARHNRHWKGGRSPGACCLPASPEGRKGKKGEKQKNGQASLRPFYIPSSMSMPLVDRGLLGLGYSVQLAGVHSTSCTPPFVYVQGMLCAAMLCAAIPAMPGCKTHYYSYYYYYGCVRTHTVYMNVGVYIPTYCTRTRAQMLKLHTHKGNRSLNKYLYKFEPTNHPCGD